MTKRLVQRFQSYEHVGKADVVHRQGDAWRLPYTTFAPYFGIYVLVIIERCWLAVTLALILTLAPRAVSASQRDQLLTQARHASEHHNYPQALSIYSKLSNEQDGEAEFELANMYNSGMGVKPDLVRGTKLLHSSADHGWPDAMIKLALMYVEGEGVGEDIQAAKRLLQTAADKGSSEAEWQLSNLYMTDKTQGGLGDHKAGIDMLRKAALHGNGEAALALGKMYWNGTTPGIPRDYKQALHWLELCKTAGSIHAHILMAKMYHAGQGTPQDDRKAVIIYAQTKGGPDSNRWLSRLAPGKTVTKSDLALATRWMLSSIRAEDAAEGREFDLLNRQ